MTLSVSRASRFSSAVSEAEALGRARRQLEADLAAGLVESAIDPATGRRTYVDPITGKPFRHTLVVRTTRPEGFADAAFVPRRVGGPGTPYVLAEDGDRLVDVDHTPQTRARFIFEYVPDIDDWQPYTYYPEP